MKVLAFEKAASCLSRNCITVMSKPLSRCVFKVSDGVKWVVRRYNDCLLNGHINLSKGI